MKQQLRGEQAGPTSRLWVPCRTSERRHVAAALTRGVFCPRSSLLPTAALSTPAGRQRPRCSGLPEPCLPPRHCATALSGLGPLMLLSLSQ